MLKRRDEREILFLLLFENDFNNYGLDSILENKNEVSDSPFKITDFIKNSFLEIKKNQDYIDDLISNHLIKWEKNRISRVSLAILRLATYEIFFNDDIPDNVSINEAVELAKKYGVDSEFSFINGILGSLCKEKQNN